MKRILVIRGGAIGDFVLTLPAIKLLRDGFPDARLEILGYKHIVALAENRFYADSSRSIEYSALAGFFARGSDLPEELAAYFHGFDLVVSYLFDPDGVFEANLRRCGVEMFLACPPKILGDEHAAAQLARPLEQLGRRLIDPAAKLYPNDADRAAASAMLGSSAKRVVALHPGSGSPTKNWPIENWCELARRLAGTKDAGELLIVGGEADADVLVAMKDALARSGAQFAENLPLPQLAAVLQQSALFVGHDSGISHIAAAVETPCVLLFGPTDPTVWAPQNQNVQVVRGANGDIASIKLKRVEDAAKAVLQSMS